MARISRRIALLFGVAAAVIAAGAAAQAQQVFRYVDKDGKVVYSDRSPPADSKDVQAKRLSPNFIENNDVPLALTQATERFPVTLYTFACGAVCQNAEAPAQPARRSVHDRQRRGRQGRGAAAEADGRAAGAGAADRRQADRQGLQRGALDGDARRSRLPEDRRRAASRRRRRPKPRRRRRPRRPRPRRRRSRSPAAATRSNSDAAFAPRRSRAGGAARPAAQRRRGRAPLLVRPPSNGAIRLEARHLERQLAQRAPAAPAGLARGRRGRTSCACRKPRLEDAKFPRAELAAAGYARALRRTAHVQRRRAARARRHRSRGRHRDGAARLRRRAEARDRGDRRRHAHRRLLRAERPGGRLGQVPLQARLVPAPPPRFSPASSRGIRRSRWPATSTSRRRTATSTIPDLWRGQVLCSRRRARGVPRLARRSASQDSFRLFEQPEKTFSWWDYRQLAFPKNRGLRIDHILLSPRARGALHRLPHRPQCAQGRAAVGPRAGDRRARALSRRRAVASCRRAPAARSVARVAALPQLRLEPELLDLARQRVAAPAQPLRRLDPMAAGVRERAQDQRALEFALAADRRRRCSPRASACASSRSSAVLPVDVAGAAPPAPAAARAARAAGRRRRSAGPAPSR